MADYSTATITFTHTYIISIKNKIIRLELLLFYIKLNAVKISCLSQIRCYLAVMLTSFS